MENNYRIQMRHFYFLMSFIVTFAICFFIRENSINVLDHYDYFQFGDTIFSKQNKSIDLRIFYYFFVIFILLFIACYKFLPDFKLISLSLSVDSVLSFDSLKKIAMVFIGSTFSIYCFYCSVHLGKTLYHINHMNLITLLPFLAVAICSFKKNKLIVVQISQLFFSFSPLLLINNFQLQSGHAFSIPISLELKVLLYSMVILLLFASYSDIKKGRLILSSSVFFILMLSVGGMERLYVPDEYHWGEMFTSYHQLFDLGQAAYSEYIPTKGGYHVLIGFVNHIFFDGNYINLLVSYRITSLILSLILVLVFRHYISNTYLLLISFFNVLPIDNQYYLPLFGLFILGSASVWKSNYRFLLAYTCLSFIYFVYYNAFGIAFGVSLLPVVCLSLYDIYKKKEKPTKVESLIFLVIIIIALWQCEYIYQSILYCLENSKYNLFYWGNYGPGKRMILSNCWILIYLYWLYVFIVHHRKLANTDKVWIYFLLLFPLLLLTYSEGRADNYFVRAFYFSGFYAAISFCCVLSFNSRLERKHRAVILCLSIVLLLAGHHYFVRYGSPLRLNSYQSIMLDPNLQYVSKSEIPGMGSGFIDKNIYRDLQSEYKLIKTLKDDETFLLVDEYETQSVRYSLFNKKIPTISHSVLNIPSLKSQLHELGKIKKSNVKIVRISEGLRRYQLFYKYFLNGNYKMAAYAGRRYLIENQLFDKLLSQGMIQAAPLTDVNLILHDISYLPIKWGSAVENEEISRLIHAPATASTVVRVSSSDGKNYLMGDNARFTFEQTQADILQADFLFMDVSLEGKAECDVKLLWNDDSNAAFDDNRSIKFKVHSGMNVVPLSDNYLWFKSNHIRDTQLRVNFCPGTTIQFHALDFAFYGQ